MAIIGGSTPTYQNFTEEMQTAAFNLGVGLFGIPLGTSFLSEISNYMTQTEGATVDSLYDVVMNSSVGQNSLYYPSYLTNEQFATRLANNLIGTSGTVVSADAWTAGKDWVVAALNGGMSRAEASKMAVDAVAAVDATDASYGAARSMFDNKVTVAQYYTFTANGGSTDVTVLADVLSGVTNDAATVANAEDAIDSGAGAGGTNSFTLTSGADNITGSSGNDVITGGLGTLSNVDEIHGGAGTDSLTVTFNPELATAGAATAATPIISGVEILNINNRNHSAALDFTDIRGVETLNIGGGYNLDLANMTKTLTAVNLTGYSALLTVDHEAATASTAAYGLTLNASASTSIGLVYSEDSGSTALVDTLTINALNDVTLSTASTFSGIEQIKLMGDGNVSISVLSAGGATGGILGTGVSDLTANNTAAGIDGSALSGNLTVRWDEAADIRILGGGGADTFTMTANLNTNDTLDGGAGADVLNAQVANYVRPVVTNVETFNLQVTAASTVTADMRDVVGLNTVNLMLGGTAVLDKVGSSVTTITINSSNSTGNDLSVKYGTAAAASDVTLNLGNGVQSIFQTAAATATAMGLGDVVFSGNSGSLTVKTIGTANYGVDTVTLNDFTAVTLDAASGSVVVSGAVNFGTAQTVTLQAGAAKALVVSGAMTLNADTITVNAGGSSALVDVSAVTVGTANTITVTTDAAMTGQVGFSADKITFQSAAAATAAVSLDTFTINALGGDAVIGTALFHSGATSINTLFDINMGGTAVNVTINDLTFNDIAKAGTASENSLTLSISGTGSFTLSCANVDSSNVTLSIDASGLASGSNVTIDLSKVADTDATVSAVFGANSGNYIGAAGVDTIEVGLGAMTVDGGLGNDTITFNNTAVNYAHVMSTAIAGSDTIDGAGTGDVILFGGAYTSTAMTLSATAATGAGTVGTAAGASGIWTGALSATTAASTAIGVYKTIAIYTAAGDTYIEVLNTTAITTGGVDMTAGISGSINQIVLLNKDFTAITAAFKLDTTGSGLMITLL